MTYFNTYYNPHIDWNYPRKHPSTMTTFRNQLCKTIETTTTPPVPPISSTTTSSHNRRIQTRHSTTTTIRCTMMTWSYTVMLVRTVAVFLNSNLHYNLQNIPYDTNVKTNLVSHRLRPSIQHQIDCPAIHLPAQYRIDSDIARHSIPAATKRHVQATPNRGIQHQPAATIASVQSGLRWRINRSGNTIFIIISYYKFVYEKR